MNKIVVSVLEQSLASLIISTKLIIINGLETATLELYIELKLLLKVLINVRLLSRSFYDRFGKKYFFS